MSGHSPIAVAQTKNFEHFLGIDFACKKKNLGNCLLTDDGADLLLDFARAAPVDVVLTAVDCPLGTSSDFLDVLNGELPAKPSDESLATRETERWLRKYVTDNYESVSMWDEAARKLYGRTHYFHTTTHVQPTVAMRIVPKCLHWLLTEQARRLPSKSGPEALHEARQGVGNVVEAHPRMFLYSVVEKQYRRDRASVTREVLANVADYKKAPKHRRFVYSFLQRNSGWLHPHGRTLQPDVPPDDLLESDHAFDAFLSALTAWSHHRSMTIRWDQTRPGLPKAAVLREGHILVLAEKEQARA